MQPVLKTLLIFSLTNFLRIYFNICVLLHLIFNNSVFYAIGYKSLSNLIKVKQYIPSPCKLAF